MPAETQIAYVHLSVADVGTARHFYQSVVGLQVLNQASDSVPLGPEPDGDPLLILSHLPGARPRSTRHAERERIGIVLPGERELGQAAVRLQQQGAVVTGASDHGQKLGLHLQDPDGNEVELYSQRPPRWWPARQPEGETSQAVVDVNRLIQGAQGSGENLPAGTRIGQLQLLAGQLDQSRGFYVDQLGMGITAPTGPDTWFLGAGKHHPQVVLFAGNGDGNGDTPGPWLGLHAYGLTIPNPTSRRRLLTRLQEAGATLVERDSAIGSLCVAVADPDGRWIEIIQC